MNILFLNAYFYPENISFSHLERDLIEGLIAKGNEIFVLTPIPTRGISPQVAKRYRRIKQETLFNGHVHVQRFWAPQERKNVFSRALRYLWCNFRELQLGKRYKHIDVVFAVSTPPTQGLLGGKLSKKLGCPLIYSLQDVFPDSLETTGLSSRNSLLWRIGRKIEDRTYRNSHKIIVISDAIKNNLLNKGVPENKITVVSNWIDADAIKPVNRELNRIYAELGLTSDQFVVVYAGNFGAAQGADCIIEAAEKLKENKSIRFVIFGGGAGFEDAKAAVKQKKLKNVIINPLLPQERVPEVYSLGDVAIITCKPGVGNSGMPSKTWSIMACNTPIIAAFDTDSELAEILKKANAGICVEPGGAKALAEAIVHQAEQAPQKKGNSAREYVLKNASRANCVEKYCQIIAEEVGTCDS